MTADISHPEPGEPALLDAEDPAVLRDPYPAYRRLRERPPARHEATGLWLLSRHADVSAALRDRRLQRVFTPREPQAVLEPWNVLNSRAMLDLEPPDHTRQRRVVSAAFTPRRVEALRGRARALADGLLDAGVSGGEVDVVTALAEPLPVAVIAELLGVPEGDRPLLQPWSHAIVGLYELAPDAAAEAAAVRAAVEFDGYLRELVAARRRSPGDDLLSALIGAARSGSDPSGEGLSEDEVVAVAALLLNAGHEATVNALGNGVLALLEHPGSWERLAADPGLVPPAVDELLRYDAPLALFQRTAAEEVTVGGVTLPAGARVGLLLGSAGRDGTVFADPDRLHLARSPNPHLAFGAGIHFCLGAPLARLELAEAYAALLRRSPHLEQAGPAVRRPGYQFRGLTSLPVRPG